ncbi:hypothetical protein K474DRAFT_1584772 [Panus rudis PR-1116 ss-1]|nr:hypothetical protein K474DRAFT_1584772 [Panus rudis PR-1116 ss-1]
MCHRQLRFYKATACGHLTFTGDTTIDCGSPLCFLSKSHPANCGSPGSNKARCDCPRYYTSVSSRPQTVVC